MEIIFKELKELAASLEEREIKQFINEIIKCKGSIIGIGAGRMGYALQAFVMRLSHLGYNSYMIVLSKLHVKVGIHSHRRTKCAF